jgi:hypothetical protein
MRQRATKYCCWEIIFIIWAVYVCVLVCYPCLRYPFLLLLTARMHRFAVTTVQSMSLRCEAMIEKCYKGQNLSFFLSFIHCKRISTDMLCKNRLFPLCKKLPKRKCENLKSYIWIIVGLHGKDLALDRIRIISMGLDCRNSSTSFWLMTISLPLMCTVQKLTL